MRAFLGVTYIYAGVQKLSDAGFLHPAATAPARARQRAVCEERRGAVGGRSRSQQQVLSGRVTTKDRAGTRSCDAPRLARLASGSLGGMTRDPMRDLPGRRRAHAG